MNKYIKYFILIGCFFIFTSFFYYQYKKSTILTLQETNIEKSEDNRDYYIFDKNPSTNTIEKVWKFSFEKKDINLILKEIIKEWVNWINQHYQTSLLLSEHIFALSTTGIIILFKNNFFEHCKTAEDEFIRFASLFKTIKEIIPSIQSLYIYKDHEEQKSKFLTEDLYKNSNQYISQKISSEYNEKTFFKLKPVYFFANYSIKEHKIYDMYERPILLNILKNKQNENSIIFKPKISEESIKNNLNELNNCHLIGISLHESKSFKINIIKYPFELNKKESKYNEILIPYFGSQKHASKITKNMQSNIYETLKMKYPNLEINNMEYAHKTFDGLITPTIILEIGITNKTDILLVENILNTLL